MRLLGSHTSPFVRRVRVVAAEKGLTALIRFVETNPFADDPELQAANPLSRVPALLDTPLGTLYDSRVIVEYLDQLSPQPVLLPAAGPARWDCLRRAALAEGIMDVAAAHVMEARRADGLISPLWQARRETAMRKGAQELGRMLADAEWPLDLGSIATAVALAYLDFRHAAVDWRSSAAPLAAWLDTFSERESMQLTRPPAA